MRFGYTSLSMSVSVSYVLSRISIRAFSSPTPPQPFPFFSVVGVAHFILRGNWSVDLQAGSQFGYKLLFVILLAGLFAVILQVFFRCCHFASRCNFHPLLVKRV